MELSRFLRPSDWFISDWFINVSIGGAGGEDSNIQKGVYFSGKNAYLYASTGSGVTELHIFGNSVQDGTPSIENPVPIISVGENYLQLYSLDINDPSKSGQIIDFGNIKLRSLPNGVCDEIVYKNGQWKHIQRISSQIIDKNTVLTDQITSNNENGHRVLISTIDKLLRKNPGSNTNISSKISNSANVSPRFWNYDITICVLWSTDIPTFEEAKNMLMGTEFLCELAEPIETILDLPKLQTLNGTTYLLTNDQQVKPYLQGYYDVDTTISGKKIEYIQADLIGYYTAEGRSNTDENKNILPDLSGNGNDLENRNFAYTVVSGYGQGYIQYDGIDDYSICKNTYSDMDVHVHCVCSDYDNIANEDTIWGSGSSTGTVSRLYNRNGLITIDPSGSTSWLNGNEYTNKISPTNELSIWSSNIHSDYIRLNLGTLSNNAIFFSKVKIYDFLLYDRYLIDEEVQNNFLVSQIRNGINIPDDVDPIDIIAERTYASGKKFPVYNTYRDRDNDNIESFKILGYTVQEGTPTPEAPIPLLSVGDEGLKLCISDSETGIALQVIDFGNIVLRSLPNGVCDSIEWDGKNWRLVQRIVSIIIDENTTIQDQLEASNRIVVQVNYTLVTKSSANNTNLCSKISNSASSVPRFHNYPNTIYVVWNSNKPATFEEAKSLIMGAEFCCELAEPVETILEGIPAPQTSDNETWFGTPSALVKPYMMCECKVKKALKYQGDISAWWYFGGNKSNETDRQITDISGNGNDLTPYNFAWNRESGWDQGGIHSDGIDDYLIYNEELSIENILIITSEFENKSGSLKYVLGFRSGNNNGGLCITVNNRMGSANSYLISSPNNVLPEPLNYLLLTNNVSNYSSGISLLNFFGGTGYCSNGNLHEVILFGNYLTDSEYDNNVNVAKQRNGVDGDINIIPEPEVYYDFSLYNNTDFPTTIENLATDKSKALQLFNFAGTEESGFFEGALVSDGIDDYAIMQNQTEGFKTVFIECIPMKLNNTLYTQGRFSQTFHFTIYNYQTSIAYSWQNEGGETYIDGELNESTICRNLLNKRQIITIVNEDVNSENSYTPIFFCSFNLQERFMSAKTFKFLGFKEALTAEQIQEVINQYFSKNLLADSNGDLLTDSKGYLLTSN